MVRTSMCAIGVPDAAIKCNLHKLKGIQTLNGMPLCKLHLLTAAGIMQGTSLHTCICMHTPMHDHAYTQSNKLVNSHSASSCTIYHGETPVVATLHGQTVMLRCWILNTPCKFPDSYHSYSLQLAACMCPSLATWNSAIPLSPPSLPSHPRCPQYTVRYWTS